MIKGGALVFFLSVFSVLVAADEKYDHFPALESPDLKTALCNLKVYNEKLYKITSKEKLDSLDMVKIHELTYTIENSIQRIQKELTQLATELEEVHLASEKLDAKAIQENGDKFLQGSSLFSEPLTCK